MNSRSVRRQDATTYLGGFPAYRYSHLPHPYALVPVPEASVFAPRYGYPPHGPPHQHSYGRRKPLPYYPVPIAAQSVPFPAYSKPILEKHSLSRPVSEETAELISKYAPPPKRYAVPKYYLTPIAVPTPYRYRVRRPPRPAPQHELFQLSDVIPKSSKEKLTSESKQAETKTKSVNNSDAAYLEIGGIGYKNIWNTLTNTLSQVKLGAENVDEDITSEYDRVRERKVKFKLGTTSARKASPFIQIGQSKFSFQHDNNGGMTITFGKAPEK